MKKKEITERYDLLTKLDVYYDRIKTLQENTIVDVYAYKSSSDRRDDVYNYFSLSVEERKFIVMKYFEETEKIRDTLKAMGVEDA